MRVEEKFQPREARIEEEFSEPATDADQSVSPAIRKTPESADTFFPRSLQKLFQGDNSQKRGKQRRRNVDQSHKQRTPMGEYIIPEGGKPLTNNALASPGPANYTLPSVSLTRPHSPEWSILNRNIYDPVDLEKPAPNAYDIPDTVTLKNRFTLKKKLKTNKKVIAGPCRVGPAYRVKNHETGKNAFKYSMPRARRDKVVTGPPNALVLPIDTHVFSVVLIDIILSLETFPSPYGYKSFGSELFTEDGVLPHAFHATFTSVPVTRYPDHPGPSDYTQPELDCGLEKSFGVTLERSDSTDVPGPQYDIGTFVGEGPAYSITLPRPLICPGRAPSPGAYMTEREYSHKEKVTMHCHLPTPEPDKIPGPNIYQLRKEVDKPEPWSSIKSRTRVPYPAVLSSAFSDSMMDRSPGPAAHDVRRDPVIRDKGASLKKPFIKLTDGRRPGPSDHGRVECDPLSSKIRAPAFSMRPLWRELRGGPNPGPAAYRAVPLEPGLQTTVKGRPRQFTKPPMPAPNAYIPPTNSTRFGMPTEMPKSLSSRHSPFVYSGMKSV